MPPKKWLTEGGSQPARAGSCFAAYAMKRYRLRSAFVGGQLVPSRLHVPQRFDPDQGIAEDDAQHLKMPCQPIALSTPGLTELPRRPHPSTNPIVVLCHVPFADSHGPQSKLRSLKQGLSLRDWGPRTPHLSRPSRPFLGVRELARPLRRQQLKRTHALCSCPRFVTPARKL
jgi:hypothetical protein